MRIAVSLTDDLLAKADEAARELGVSRNGLVARALRSYVRRRERAKITATLNEVHGTKADEDTELVRCLKTKLDVRAASREHPSKQS